MGDEVLGQTFTVSAENSDDTLDAFTCRTYTIVGYISSPLYMDLSRGSTSIGNGNVVGYLYVMPEAVELDYFTDIYLTLGGNYAIYTDAYTDFMESMSEQLKPGITLLADERFASLKGDALEEYNKGYSDYSDALEEYNTARAEALQTLEDALKELQDGQRQIDENRLTIQQGFLDLEAGKEELNAQKVKLEAAWQAFYSQKEQTYQQLDENQATLEENQKASQNALLQLNDGIGQLEEGLVSLNSGLAQVRDGLQQTQSAITMLTAAIAQLQAEQERVGGLLQDAMHAPEPDADMIQQLNDQYVSITAQLETYSAYLETALQTQLELTAQEEALVAQKETLDEQYAQLLQNKQTVEAALITIEKYLAELEAGRAKADEEFATAEAELNAGQQTILDMQLQMQQAQKELEDGLAELEEAQRKIDDGMVEYAEGKAEADAEFADAWSKLEQAAAELADAWETIDSMEPVQLYITDRNTNTGYLALDSNSNILAGVSRVLPVFFLLVAAMVCVTTMSRMVAEERTQIGTFKALGYTGGAIICKYLLYAGSASLVGCALGVLLGSGIFPVILWDVYGLLLNITPDVVLKMDWPLCLSILACYAALMLSVTWYCCRVELKEVPAELIRPKSPTSGKKIWLEYLWFWKRISFLNKVMLRNVFRYRQRMLMMLLGIGGCTALLLTGFGLRDSIVNIVSIQFEQVTVYDMQVYFADTQTQEEQETFCHAMQQQGADAHFFYQTTVEMEFADSVSELSMITAKEETKDFIHFRRNGEELPLPGLNEVLLSIGMAEKMGISVGDALILRDSNMRELHVTVGGIYENQVQNYVIVTPETLQTQWGHVPGSQTAVVNVDDNMDVHQISAQIGTMHDVLNVIVSEDTATQVRSMLKALDSIVIVIVVCAGALAFTVIYNLTNINITERLREIATIKVLGFRAAESAAYVFKENLLLTFMGMIFGLFLGKALLDFVITQVKIDMLWLTTKIEPVSCVYAVALTLISALIVDLLLYFKLDKINMAEALKSVE